MPESARDFHGLLIEAGLLPDPLPTGLERAFPSSPGENLLPWLARVWRAGADAAGGRNKSRARRILAWLDFQVERGARLTWGIPVTGDGDVSRWLGPRLAWWPRGVPEGRRVGPVSSRLGRSMDTRHSWFTVLRAACAKLDPENDLLLSAPGTTTARYVERCAALFGVGLLRVVTTDGQGNAPGQWWRQIRRLSSEVPSISFPARVYLSPILTGNHVALPSACSSQMRALPLRDRALVALSDRLVVLYMRRKGNLERLVRARLSDPLWPVTSVRIALGRGLTDRRLADTMLAEGAVGWLVLDKREQGDATTLNVKSPASRQGPTGPSDSVGHVGLLPPRRTWEYLTHCTRRQRGPWPDQEETDYLDGLILDQKGLDRSPLSSITRIVWQRRLLASARTIRGGYRVVSFTSIPLAELHELRVFRPHRCRWDFEPYGICIRRDWLQQQNTRPVRYAGDTHWVELPESDRPFFQLDHTRVGRGRLTIDWTVEQEWRHLGDLPLHGLPSDAGLVFVPTEDEAEPLAAISPWPVVVVPREK